METEIRIGAHTAVYCTDRCRLCHSAYGLWLRLSAVYGLITVSSHYSTREIYKYYHDVISNLKSPRASHKSQRPTALSHGRLGRV